MHFDDFGLDAEITQLQFDQPRHGLQRLGRIAAVHRRRIVERRQRRQLLGCRFLEQGDLEFLLDTLALFDFRRRLLDLRRRAAGHTLLFLANHFLARLLHLPTGPDVASGGNPAGEPIDGGEHGSAGAIHDREPRHAQELRNAREPQRQQQQRRTQKAQAGLCVIADERAENAARGVRIRRYGEMQARQPAAGDQGQKESKRPKGQRGPRLAGLLASLPIEQPSREPDHQRKQERRRAEQQHQQPGQLRAERSDDVGKRPGLTGGGEGRIVAIVGQQSREHDERHRTEYPQRAFAKRANDGWAQPHSVACLCCACQCNAFVCDGYSYPPPATRRPRSAARRL